MPEPDAAQNNDEKVAPEHDYGNSVHLRSLPELVEGTSECRGLRNAELLQFGKSSWWTITRTIRHARWSRTSPVGTLAGFDTYLNPSLENRMP